MEVDYEALVSLLKTRLKPKRFVHSLCVMEEAVVLAKQLGTDCEKAKLAGLLHDITKNTPDEEQLALMKEHGVTLTELELAAPKLYHAMSGPVYIREILHIDDPDVLSAIRYHTTARENMTKLEQVLYLADFVSADRDYDGVETLRETAHRDFFAAMKEALAFTINELVEKNAQIHPDTLAAWNDLIAKERKN